MIKEDEDHPIYRIVLTGGPCSGKTTAMAVLSQELSARGFHVLVVPEAATALIGGGVAPWTVPSAIHGFQFYVLDTQRLHESVFVRAALEYSQEKPVVLLYDRGQLDGAAFVDPQVWQIVLDTFALSKSLIWQDYDAVIHLVTAAKGAENFYTCENNPARTETPEQAIAIDSLTRDAWVGHPHLRVIDNSTDFDGKVDRVKREIFSIVGRPEPIEKEEKFLITGTNTNAIKEALQDKLKIPFEIVEIEQSYLVSADPATERRVRRRGQHGNYSYFYTEKTAKPKAGERVEVERYITPRQYAMLFEERDRSMNAIRKDRYCFLLDGLYYEIDVFKNVMDGNGNLMVIAEIETDSDILAIDQNLLDAVRECSGKDVTVRRVTSDPLYKNAHLSREVATA